MFFSKGFIYRTYDIEAIKRFYHLLSIDIPDLSIEWRRGRYIESEAVNADIVLIKRNEKILFMHNRNNDKGFINFSVVGQEEQIVLNAAREADIVSGPHSFKLGVGCALGYIFLMSLIFVGGGLQPELESPILFCLLILLVGLAMYIGALINNGGRFILAIASVISIIGLLLLAPASLLLFPIMLAVNRQALFKKVYKDYRG